MCVLIDELKHMLENRKASFWNDKLWKWLNANENDFEALSDLNDIENHEKAEIWTLMSWYYSYLLKNPDDDSYYLKLMDLPDKDADTLFFKLLAQMNRIYAAPEHKNNVAFLNNVISGIKTIMSGGLDNIRCKILEMHYQLVKSEYDIYNIYSLNDISDGYLVDNIKECDCWISRADQIYKNFFIEHSLMFRVQLLKAYLRLATNEFKKEISAETINYLENDFEKTFDRMDNKDQMTCIKARALNDAGVNCQKENPDMAIEYYKESIDFYKKLNIDTFIHNSYSNLIMAYNNKAIKTLVSFYNIDTELRKYLLDVVKSYRRNQVEKMNSNSENDLIKLMAMSGYDNFDYKDTKKSELFENLKQSITNEIDNYSVRELKTLIETKGLTLDLSDIPEILDSHRTDYDGTEKEEKIKSAIQKILIEAKDAIRNADEQIRITSGMNLNEIDRIQISRFSALVNYTNSKLVFEKKEKISILVNDALKPVNEIISAIENIEMLKNKPNINEIKLQYRCQKQCYERLAKLSDDSLDIKSFYKRAVTSRKNEKKYADLSEGKTLR